VVKRPSESAPESPPEPNLRPLPISGSVLEPSISASDLHFRFQLKRLYSEGSRYNQKYNLMQQQGTFEPLGDV